MAQYHFCQKKPLYFRVCVCLQTHEESQKGSNCVQLPSADFLLALPKFACHHTLQMPSLTITALQLAVSPPVCLLWEENLLQVLTPHCPSRPVAIT